MNIKNLIQDKISNEEKLAKLQSEADQLKYTRDLKQFGSAEWHAFNNLWNQAEDKVFNLRERMRHQQ